MSKRWDIIFNKKDMKNIVWSLFISIFPSFAQIPEQTFPKPTPSQLAWKEAEIGFLISYDWHFR